MSEVTPELMYEVLKNIQERVGRLEEGQRTIREEITAVRLHMVGMQKDVNNIYVKAEMLDEPIARLENRLDLAPAE